MAAWTLLDINPFGERGVHAQGDSANLDNVGAVCGGLRACQ
ncbi:MAG: hypothetical protein ACYDDX_11950 [Acidithiobacillus ferrivorans]